MSYSITYPESVAHLVLADPWGLPEKPDKVFRQIPWYIKTVAYIFRPLNPFWAIRAAGPKGPALLERARPDLVNKFADLNENGNDVRFGDYIYHCNAQDPSGESAFHSLMHDFGWSKFPLIKRMPDLRQDIDITAMYGQKSWVSVISPDEFPRLRPESYVSMHILEGAGHHVYSDAKDEFNSIILRASEYAEKKLKGV
ncbi:unnamed protein product [Allacma fusca]|uniref:Uncharacterized protein n=1 Tax=Allacma fusca TaxID=39272 RepID=A0A8J2JD66_9HEXA|nr:unnamed protein product [Allacma fusca]